MPDAPPTRELPPAPRRRRWIQIVIIVALFPLCWWGMMAVHELGHVLAALMSGGRVAKVVLHPLMISRTDVSPNPHPLFVVWSGPLFGAAAPLLFWAMAAWMRLPGAYLLRFFAGFCLIANGVYIGIGSFEGVGDAGQMQELGSHRGWLWVFGLIAVPGGLLLWHRLGPHFGIGKTASP